MKINIYPYFEDFLQSADAASLFVSLQVLSCHIPFLVSSVEDFKDHIPRETDMKVKSTHRHVRIK